MDRGLADLFWWLLTIQVIGAGVAEWSSRLYSVLNFYLPSSHFVFLLCLPVTPYIFSFKLYLCFCLSFASVTLFSLVLCHWM